MKKENKRTLSCIVPPGEINKLRRNLSNKIVEKTTKMLVAGKIPKEIISQVRKEFASEPFFIADQFNYYTVTYIKLKHKEDFKFKKSKFYNHKCPTWLDNNYIIYDKSLLEQVTNLIIDLTVERAKRKEIFDYIIEKYSSNKYFVSENFNLRYIDHVRGKNKEEIEERRKQNER